jgi:hypothetical protein
MSLTRRSCSYRLCCCDCTLWTGSVSRIIRLTRRVKSPERRPGHVWHVFSPTESSGRKISAAFTTSTVGVELAKSTMRFHSLADRTGSRDSDVPKRATLSSRSPLSRSLKEENGRSGSVESAIDCFGSCGVRQPTVSLLISQIGQRRRRGQKLACAIASITLRPSDDS